MKVQEFKSGELSTILSKHDVVVIFTYAKWCPYSRSAWPRLNNALSKLKGLILRVNRDEHNLTDANALPQIRLYKEKKYVLSSGSSALEIKQFSEDALKFTKTVKRKKTKKSSKKGARTPSRSRSRSRKRR
jgi:thiol-disulfide isomerase/thioredoxin